MPVADTVRFSIGTSYEDVCKKLVRSMNQTSALRETLYIIFIANLLWGIVLGDCAVSAAESVAVSSETVITSHHHLCQLCTGYTPVDTMIAFHVLAHFKNV